MSESHSVAALPPPPFSTPPKLVPVEQVMKDYPGSDVAPPPPFSTPPKLVPVEQVMKDYPGSDVATLRKLTTALAREAIFGKEELCKSSLSGRNKTGGLNKKKLD